uniref:Saf-pilin pilus formation protein n=1 Tax=Enterobacter cloacae TaxID=550 RepID=A0A1S6XY41_ENTCL|nr:hypothetical protein [Enterobacter cloacae]AQX35352.1 Saf-pilin pilus formation protein [Enterobacter cloacae]
MKFSKYVIATLILTASASSLAAFDRVTTTSGNITFAAPTYPVTTTITPVTNLTSGSQLNGNKYADIAFSTSTAQIIAYRFGPAVNKFTPSANRTDSATINGNTNNANQLSVRFGSPATARPDTGGTQWFSSASAMNGIGNSIVSNGASVVNPDTYTVYIESGVYVP